MPSLKLKASHLFQTSESIQRDLEMNRLEHNPKSSDLDPKPKKKTSKTPKKDSKSQPTDTKSVVACNVIPDSGAFSVYCNQFSSLPTNLIYRVQRYLGSLGLGNRSPQQNRKLFKTTILKNSQSLESRFQNPQCLVPWKHNRLLWPSSRRKPLYYFRPKFLTLYSQTN
jgi:hypothetical protein